MAIKIDDLSSNIVKDLKEYNSSVEKILEESEKQMAKDGANELKVVSPKRSGNYAKSWSSKKDDKGYVIYNRKHYQITHLLEFGHAKKNGGRVEASPHIEGVSEKAAEEFETQVERSLNK